MPIDDLTALGLKMREARKNKDLTQQELSDLSHVSVKQIAKIEKGEINPSYLILKALAKVLPYCSIMPIALSPLMLAFSRFSLTSFESLIPKFSSVFISRCWRDEKQSRATARF